MSFARRNRKSVAVTDMLPFDFVAESGDERTSNIAGIILRFLLLKRVNVDHVWFEHPEVTMHFASRDDRSEAGHLFIRGDAGTYDWPAPRLEPLTIRLAMMEVDEADRWTLREAIYGPRTPMERLATAWDEDDEED